MHFFTLFLFSASNGKIPFTPSRQTLLPSNVTCGFTNVCTMYVVFEVCTRSSQASRSPGIAFEGRRSASSWACKAWRLKGASSSSPPSSSSSSKLVKKSEGRGPHSDALSTDVEDERRRIESLLPPGIEACRTQLLEEKYY